MKNYRWSSLVLLMLLSSCVNPGSLLAQQGGSAAPVAPKTMRLCIDPGCTNLTWVGDHYEGRLDGQTALYARYWITVWTADHVEIKGKTAAAADGVYPAEGTFTGRISPAGNSIVNGRDDWRIGYSKSGTMSFTATWSKTIPKTQNAAAAAPNKSAPQVANEAEIADISVYSPARQSTTNPNITLPPGASEKFAGYPEGVRAVLQPEYGLTIKDSARQCHDPAVTDPNTAVEIARFAYRAGDIARGNCWNFSAEEMGSVRAKVIYAVGLQMGWYGKKDDAKAFEIFSSLQSKRDPWAMWFLDECYTNGTGTAKDLRLASILDTWVMTHEEAMNVVRTLGTDDAAKMREKARWEALLDPPTRSSTHCSQTYVTAGGIHVPGHCDTQSVVDSDALRRRLDQIDKQ